MTCDVVTTYPVQNGSPLMVVRKAVAFGIRAQFPGSTSSSTQTKTEISMCVSAICIRAVTYIQPCYPCPTNYATWKLTRSDSKLSLKCQPEAQPGHIGTTNKYSNLTAQHRLHTTSTGLQPAPTTDIGRHATRSHRGGHWFDPSIAPPQCRTMRTSAADCHTAVVGSPA